MRSITYTLRLKKTSFKCVAVALAAASILSACSTRSVYDTPSVYSFKGKGMVPPPGMVYVPSGTIMYKSSTDDEGLTKRVSLSPFFMDATEVTNKQYREFINWVADSIAVTDYLKDDSYFLHPDKKNPEVIGKLIDWEKVRKDKDGTPLWLSSDPAITSKLMGSFVLEENGKKVLNRELVKYAFTYQQVGGKNQNEFLTENIKAFPEKNVWSTDFPNSQMSFMNANYYEHRLYDNYPIVGVTWKQARAYSDWRSKDAAQLLNRNAYLKNYQLAFSLPTESQWQYAASGLRHPEEGASNNNSLMTYSGGKSHGGKNSKKLLVNFKQDEGNYTMDGSTFTLPVKSYSSNGFGLYNMAGNVAEWTLDAYSVSAVEFVHDLNPVLVYDASDNDPEVMKRKVVRGGSWKDNGELLNKDTRNYEVQDAAHSYIGFRCVMPAPELLSDQVRTRKMRAAPSKSVKTGRASRPTESVASKGDKAE